MDEANWIALGALFVAIAGTLVSELRLRAEGKRQKDTLKAILDYVALQRDELKAIEASLAKKTTIDRDALTLQKERLAWDRIVAAAKTIGWLYEKELI